MKYNLPAQIGSNLEKIHEWSDQKDQCFDRSANLYL